MEEIKSVYEEIIQDIVQEWTLFDPAVGPSTPPPRDFITDVSREISRFSQAQGALPASSLQGKWIVATSPADIPHPFDLHDFVGIMGYILRGRPDEAGKSPSPRHDQDHRDIVFANAMTGVSFPGFIFQ
ncbi:hypothetical protein [Sorlinia euscelidii]|uniref:hypothetical protein n=1 Tax=Sorlinia euscelidii TaxID=3081148 RepID=UPI00374E0A4B